MKKIELILVLCCFSLSSVVLAATTPPKELTLHDAIWLALRGNNAIKNAEINRVVQKYNLVVAKNQFELQYALTGTSTYTYNKANGGSVNSAVYTLTPSTSLNLPSGANVNVSMPNTVSAPNAGGTYNPAVTVSLTQPLLRGFGSEITLSPLANAYDAERINRLNLRQTVISTIVKVITDYTSVVQSLQNLKAQQMNLSDVEQRLHQEQIKIQAGKVAPSDLVQVQSDLAQAQLGYASAQNALSQAKLVLLNDIGLSPDVKVVVPENIDIPAMEIPSVESVKKLVLANDVGYQTSLINQGVDVRNFKVAKDGERVQLNLSASATTGGSSGDGPSSGIESLTNGASQSGSVALNLSVPIDDVKAKQTTLAARAQVQEDEINLKNQMWMLETNAINAINNLKTYQSQLVIAKKAVDIQQKNLELSQIKRKHGLASPLDVSLQQTALTNARLSYISTEIAYYNTFVQFQQMLGKTLEDWNVEVQY